jgi:dihydroorotate dehydrogenase (fumarate)
MNLSTTYLGMRLPNPFVVGAGPLSDDLDSVKQLEDAGAAAIVLRSLYEEEITGEQMEAFYSSESHSESFAEATSYSPDPLLSFGPDEYLEHLSRVKHAAAIPVIASLNGTTRGGWTSFARLIEDAGANALELNLYHAVSDPAMSSAEVEQQMIDIVRDVKSVVKIPVAVKLSPLFTAFANFALKIDSAGADGFVLFNRFHRADIDVIELEIVRSLELSTSAELQQRLAGTAVLSGKVKASLAITGGVHTALDVIKATMAGAHVTQMVSTILRNGPVQLYRIRKGIEAWMQENEWPSLDEMRGNMGFDRIPDPAAYERKNFRMMLRSTPAHQE